MQGVQCGPVLDGVGGGGVQGLYGGRVPVDGRADGLLGVRCGEVPERGWSIVLRRVPGGLDHGHGRSAGCVDVHGVCGGQVLEGLGRGVVHRLCRGLDHKHGLCGGRDDVHGVWCGSVLDRIVGGGLR